MTPPIFNLDDEVEVIDCPGRQFKISQIWKNGDAIMYAREGMCYYPASSLRLVPKFKKGDLVEIIGPSPDGTTREIGERFTITQTYDDFSWMVGDYKDCYSAAGKHPYKAISLRLVEELEIGDFVEVILNDAPYTGRIGKVSDVGEEWIALYNMGAWRRSSLRKLTPEEVVFHTGTIGYKMRECSEEIEKATEAMRDLLAPLVDERLAAIEKRLDVQEDAIIEMDLRLDVDAEAIKVLEGERPEVIYREQFGITENANISMYSDANGKFIIDYSSGGFDLAKAVLDSMREG